MIIHYPFCKNFYCFFLIWIVYRKLIFLSFSDAKYVTFHLFRAEDWLNITFDILNVWYAIFVIKCFLQKFSWQDIERRDMIRRTKNISAPHATKCTVNLFLFFLVSFAVKLILWFVSFFGFQFCRSNFVKRAFEAHTFTKENRDLRVLCKAIR